MQKRSRSLEGQEEVHSGDTLPRAFRFFGRIKTYPTEHALHKYPHEQPLNLKINCWVFRINNAAEIKNLISNPKQDPYKYD